nr:DUF429 domain-containing protein [Actinotalea sp. JY-7885]
MTYLGVDLAWGERNRTGLAALDESGRLVASSTVRTDDEIKEFVDQHGRGDVVAAIDAPLVVPNETGRRECEALLQAEFGRYDAGAHSSNRSRPWLNPPRGEVLANRLGWDVDPTVSPGPGRSVAIEVYPHPAMVTLFDLDRVLPYKNKPGRTTASRRSAFLVLLDAMEELCEEPMRLRAQARWADIRTVITAAERPMHLAAVEDEVDAIFCAYLAWLWARQDSALRVLGDARVGYIVVPGPPRRAPGRRSAVPGGAVTVQRGHEIWERVHKAAEQRGLTEAELIAKALDALG